MRIQHFIILILISFSSIAQEKIVKFKTTDLYYVELPSNIGEARQISIITEWVVNQDEKTIIYKRDGKTLKFYYLTENVIENNLNGSNIIEFLNLKENITISGFGNYIKIKHCFNLIENTSPKEYSSIATYTNYNINDYFEILENGINLK